MLGVLQNYLGRRPPAGDDKIVRHLRAHVEAAGPIACPLILISQISRSGGTWLSQLFDHHPQIWAHPGALKIFYPDNWTWPDLSAARDAAEVWNVLRYEKIEKVFGSGGFRQGTPMMFDAAAQRALFLALAAARAPSADREWIDLYFTSFFYAWLDYQRKYGEKRYVTGFASILSRYPETMAGFRKVYPDGYLISLIREPLGWYSSVKRRSAPGKEKKHDGAKSHYGSLDDAESAYLKNIEAMRSNAALFGDHFIAIEYAALVADTEGVMRGVAERIGIDFHPTLTEQTFNGMPMGRNTSFPEGGERPSVLADEEKARIKDGPMTEAYRSVRALCAFTAD